MTHSCFMTRTFDRRQEPLEDLNSTKMLGWWLYRLQLFDLTKEKLSEKYSFELTIHRMEAILKSCIQESLII